MQMHSEAVPLPIVGTKSPHQYGHANMPVSTVSKPCLSLHPRYLRGRVRGFVPAAEGRCVGGLKPSPICKVPLPLGVTHCKRGSGGRGGWLN